MAKKERGVDRAWIRALERGPVKKLYVMHGEESFRRHAAVGILRRRFVPEGLEDFNCIRLSGKSLKLADLAEAVDGPPVMAERKLVLVRDFDLFRCPDKDALAQLFSNLPDSVCLIFLYESLEFKPDRRTKLFAALEKEGEIANFTPAEGRELTEWVARRFAERGHTIGPSEIEYLTFRCGALMTGLLNEIEKIAAYAKSPAVTRADIDAVASRVTEAQIYELSDLLSARDFAGALGKLDELIEMREEPVVLAAAIGRQMRRLYAAKLWQAVRRPADGLTALLGLRFPFQTQRLLSCAARMTLPALRRSVILCADADYELKSSRASGSDTLRTLVLRLAALENGLDMPAGK